MTTGASTATRADRYPSRVAAHPSIIERQEPVVYGDAEGPLDAEEVSSYERDGFLVAKGLLTPGEAAELNSEIDRLATDPAQRDRRQAVVEPDGSALRSLFEVHKLDGALGRITRDPRLVNVARQLLGSDVYIHQSRVNLKPAFRGHGFYWHSDFETWHTEDGLPGMRTLSASVLLTDNQPWNGPLLTITGSHQWFVSCVGETPENHHEESLRRQEIGTPDEESLTELHRRGRIVQCLGPVGTVVFFDCNTMHGSGDNISPVPRRNVFAVYNSVENTPEAPFAAPAPRPEHIASRQFEPV